MNSYSVMIHPKDLVDAQLYATEQEVIQDALRSLLRLRPNLRIQLAVYRYQTQDISLAKAAHFAGVSYAQMKDILLEQSIQPRLGPQTMEEAHREVLTLREYFDEQQ